MPQEDFVYPPTAEASRTGVGVSVFADRERLREEMRADIEMAGLDLRRCGSLQLIDDAIGHSLGAVVLVDCPVEDAASLAALCRLDTMAARDGTRLIVSASLESLDAVFGCCSQSGVQFLVDPLRAERVIALGRELAGLSDSRLRELSDEDRFTLLRLTQQVGEIAQKLDRIGTQSAADRRGDRGDAFRFQSPVDAYRAPDQDDRSVRATRPPLPDSRLVRKIIQQRQLRARFFDGDLFADPAWDMLLDLTAARVEHARVSVTSLCIASGVPPTTALRWISQMTAAGLFERVEDETDRRRAFIQLTDRAVDAMARYFHDLGKGPAGPV